MTKFDKHNFEVHKISNQLKLYSHSPYKRPIKFFHGGTNSTRNPLKNDTSYFIDISSLNNILELNIREKFVVLEPNVSMDDLVEYTLQHNLIPPVVPEFPGITIGGAINGASLESSSYKFGQVNDSCLEYEVILGNGDILNVSSKKNSDLFYGISGSYGSIALITKVKLSLIDSKKYVRITYQKTKSLEETEKLLSKYLKDSSIDFLESIIFSQSFGAVITGRFVEDQDTGTISFLDPNIPWFFNRVHDLLCEHEIVDDLVPINDYLFRYNRGAFWMGDYAFDLVKVPENRLTKFLFDPLLHTRKLYDGLHDLGITHRYFIQDFYCPTGSLLKFLEYIGKVIGIYPIWLCPVKTTKTYQKLSPHFNGEDFVIDVGVWGQTTKFLHSPIKINRDFEKYAIKHGIKKMLYAEVFYTRDDFWKVYDYPWYKNLRLKYHALNTFPEVWDKVHVKRNHDSRFIQGCFRFVYETLKGKNLSH